MNRRSFLTTALLAVPAALLGKKLFEKKEGSNFVFNTSAPKVFVTKPIPDFSDWRMYTLTGPTMTATEIVHRWEQKMETIRFGQMGFMRRWD